MAEFRTDPLRGHVALINGQRGKRPSDFTLTVGTPPASSCPFCRGNERLTPEAIEQGGVEEWTWRLFPNLFPAVEAWAYTDIPPDPAYDVLPARGYHEVLVETPDHLAQADEYTLDHWIELMKVWQRRLRQLYQDENVKYVHIFRNQGYRGGATLVHPHQQLVALTILPMSVANRIARLSRDEQVSDMCNHCDWLAAEARIGVRVLRDDHDVVAVASFAPRFPFEWQIFGREHRRFDELSSATLSKTAQMLLSGLGALRRAGSEPDFNLVLFSTPPNLPDVHAAWAIDVLPRLSTQAGFEWGTGVHIVSTPPEEAAEALRREWR